MTDKRCRPKEEFTASDRGAQDDDSGSNNAKPAEASRHGRIGQFRPKPRAQGPTAPPEMQKKLGFTRRKYMGKPSATATAEAVQEIARHAR
jgi:hypothetical protein